MSTMLSGQRIPFHPYNQASSHSSRSRLRFRTDHTTHTPCRVSAKANDTLPANTAGAAGIAKLPNLQTLAKLSEAEGSSSAAANSRTQQNKLQPCQPSSLSGPSSIPRLPVLDFPTVTKTPSEVNELVQSPNHFSNAATVARDSRSTGQILSRYPSPNPLQKPRRHPSSQSHVQSIIHYLKTWRPPVEYYARRRYQHPSLLYPSRRPTLPSLLEERVTNDGSLVIVCPQVAISTSLRAYQRKIFPAHAPHTGSNCQHATSQAWDDESDEDIESDFSDDDDSVGSADDFEEAVTPVNSPPSNAAYFLQPLILTKPPGY